MGVYVKIDWEMACKTQKDKTVVGDAILNYSYNTFFLWIHVIKSKVSNDLDENWLSYGTFVSGGHLEFFRILKYTKILKYVIRSTLNLIAHKMMTIALSLKWTICGICDGIEFFSNSLCPVAQISKLYRIS
jgi:hypothetical protein